MEKKTKYIVEMIDISKSFGSVQANKNVNFKVIDGEIHAIIGENGAGKTTLMNILFGVLLPTAGEIRINGETVVMTSPNKAIQLGIGMVHQHFELVPSFTVAENICMGHEPRNKFGTVDKQQMYNYVQQLSEKSGLKVDPEERVEKLSVGLRQRVEILKALSRGAEILILDEPTAVLTPLECQELFAVLHKMKKQGKTIIIITHKLREVMEIADNITVLSRGETKGTLHKNETNELELASLMMGKTPNFVPLNKNPIKESEPLLLIENLSVHNAVGKQILKNINFDVRPGEILTIAGVEGNGQSELFDALLGFLPLSSGLIIAEGKDITDSNIKDRRSFCSYIPEDRSTTGLDLSASVHDNLIAGIHCLEDWQRGPRCIDYKKTCTLAEELIETYSIKTDGYEIETNSLSGGNQQKIILAREMNFGNKILICAQPTRGLDVGAARFVHERIIEMKNSGCAIVLISTDLDEVLLISDVIKVLFEGEIVATLSPEGLSPEELGLYMTGAKKMKEGIRIEYAN
ncbi:MAG: ABC transporter ATP-binding protein [Eubacteriales bacterium]|nr:ABC transporter ATP-binding protein [Eubacteriales bacterium]